MKILPLFMVMTGLCPLVALAEQEPVASEQPAPSPSASAVASPSAAPGVPPGVAVATPPPNPEGLISEDSDAQVPFVEAAVTLELNGKVCGTPRGRMMSGVRTALNTRLDTSNPKSWLSVDVLPVVEDGKIKYKMTILVERANGDSSKVTVDGVTDPTVPLKYTFGKEGTSYNAEVVFTMAKSRYGEER